MPTYNIQAIAGQVREYDTQFGPMKSYTLKLEGEMDPIELSQKASTPAPEAGTTITGDITQGKFGKKFKKEYNPGGFTSGGSSTTSGSTTSTESGAKAAFVPRDDSHIKAQWAIGQAMLALNKGEATDFATVQSFAEELFAMVDRVKGGSDSPDSVQADNAPVTGNEALNDLFPEVEPVDQGELPWTPGN